MQNIPLREIIAFLSDSILAIHGPTDKAISHPSALRESKPGALCFNNHDGEMARAQLSSSSATVILTKELETYKGYKPTLIVVDNPRKAFIECLAKYFAPKRTVGIHPTAVIAPSTTYGPDVYIGANCSIGAHCTIGAQTVIHPNVTIYENTKIGSRVTIHANTVIGADGFGYERKDTGELLRFPHIGGVTIEDDVEIGSNTSIDRGTLTDTTIKRGAKIDNLVHIAHNVLIDEDACVVALSMIAGSTSVGKQAWISPGSAIIDRVNIGQNSVVGLGAVVTKRVPDNETVIGVPARPSRDFKRLQGALRDLVKSKD